MTIPLGAARHARTPEETFLLRLEKTDTCWLWTGVPNLKGYGVFNTKPRRHMAHRFAYLLWVGPIPPGYEVDHLCGVRLCCRPEHLEAVTHRENVRRSANHVGVKARKTVCVNGHDFDAENTYIAKDGTRHCRACRRKS